MGACLGRCFDSITLSNTFTRNSPYRRHQDIPDAQEGQLTEVDQPLGESHEQHCNDQSRSRRLLSFLTLKHFKQNSAIPTAVEMVEKRSWPNFSNKYTKLGSTNASVSSGLDNQLQMLDPRGLLGHQECLSNSASSIDLEWENEGMPTPLVDSDKTNTPEDSVSEASLHNSQPSSLTASPWSRVSTPNSLEWDPVETDVVDIETENLLTEIELLTDRALEETGEWTNSNVYS
ncbi:hypothetical protein QAD02_012478 [Eretmocerus hayati]|uniref:Uncharacterized protein n=1 Tax=Eretmocerus hayati TaxID=131215 RepID=A0ACC2P1I3_9HYME|nr:hypothetical protein QAD02_012478 [Eretmocerus hayati]